MLGRRDAGFTLVEMMVTLAIVSVMTGAAVLGLSFAGRDAQSEAEARRFSQYLTLAADEAMISGDTLALRWDEDGYQFLGWSDAEQGWTVYRLEALGQRRELPAGMRLESAAPALIEIEPDRSGRAAAFALSGRSGEDWRVTFNGYEASLDGEAS